jgi:predicted N-acetyltransferase YhbS
MLMDGRLPGSEPVLPEYHLTVVPTAELAESAKREIVDLCTRAFEEDFGDLFELVAFAVSPVHVQARIGGNLVGHAMWSERTIFLADGTTVAAAYLDAVAIDPAYQNRGLGSVVIKRLMAEVHGFALGCLSTNRPNFYARLGWELWTGPKAVSSENWIQPTPEETVMIHRTANSPAINPGSLLVVESRPGDSW